MKKRRVQQGTGREKAVETAESSILTPEMVKRAREIAADKQQSLAMLKRAGILNERGTLAKEYAN
jgi:hypothetical protein